MGCLGEGRGRIYAELQVASAFSFLRGASSPEELAATASVLGISAIGVTDLNSVAGVVRMWDAAKDVGIRLVVGARLSFRDGTPDLLCYPRDRAAWGRLTRLLTVGKGRVPHGDTGDAAKVTNRCFLHYADLLEHGEGRDSACCRTGSAGWRIPGKSSAPESGFSRQCISCRQSPLSRR